MEQLEEAFDHIWEDAVELESSGSEEEEQQPVGAALNRNIEAWCEATGLPTSIKMYVRDRVYVLHKYPLVSRSGFFKRMLTDCKEVRVPADCPGGLQVFELVLNFCYGSTILMDPSNVAALRCAAQFLDMSEEYGRSNLCDRSDVYLTQVALQSWQDALVVLQRCRLLLPMAEELHIVSRCVEALADIACTELLEPAERGLRPPPTAESEFWRDMGVATRAGLGSRDWWVKDLLCLPCALFQRIVAGMRRQGMEEQQVCLVVMRYAEHHLLSFAGGESESMGEQSPASHRSLVEAVVRMLAPPPGKRCPLPVAFLLALLRCALPGAGQSWCVGQLEAMVACQLHQATITDYLLPYKGHQEQSAAVAVCEVKSMQRILSQFLAGAVDGRAVSKVAKVWDQFLGHIAHDPALSASTFSELAEMVPASSRTTHDLLYKAIHTFLKAHSRASEEERANMCRILNCQKLSQEVAAHAVQNEMMPLRMLVQAMFLQQLHTRNTLCDHLLQQSSSASVSGRMEVGGSFRDYSTGSSSGAQDTLQALWARDDGLQQHQYHLRQAAILKADFQATYSRLRNLEEELAQMRHSLEDSCCSLSTSQPAAVKEERQQRQAEAKLRGRIQGGSNGSSGGCLGQSGGLVVRLSRTLQKLGLGGLWKSHKSSTKSTTTSQSSLRRASMRCPPPTDGDHTVVSTTFSSSMRWSSSEPTPRSRRTHSIS